MLVLIIFALIGIAIFFSFSNRVEIEKTKSKTVKTVVVEKKHGKEHVVSETTEIVEPLIEPVDEDDEDKPEGGVRSILSSIWDKIK